MTFLQGNKTYIIAGLMALTGLVRLLTGEVGITDFLNSPDILVLLNGLGLAALRHGISTSQK